MYQIKASGVLFFFMFYTTMCQSNVTIFACIYWIVCRSMCMHMLYLAIYIHSMLKYSYLFFSIYEFNSF